MEEILHKFIGGLSHHYPIIYRHSTIPGGAGFLPSKQHSQPVSGSPPGRVERIRLLSPKASFGSSRILRRSQKVVAWGSSQGQHMAQKTPIWLVVLTCFWLDWFKGIFTGNQSYFTIKLMGVSCKFSLKPIHWVLTSFNHLEKWWSESQWEGWHTILFPIYNYIYIYIFIYLYIICKNRKMFLNTNQQMMHNSSSNGVDWCLD